MHSEGTSDYPYYLTDEVKAASVDPQLAEMRTSLALFTAETFQSVGSELHAIGHIFGPDRRDGVSPHGHGSDEIVAVGLLLSVAGQLVAASTNLFSRQQAYAAAALLRQLVEIEYLAWAFETRDGDAERWLRSTEKERQSFFRPAILRAAGSGRWQIPEQGLRVSLRAWRASDAAVRRPLGRQSTSDTTAHV